MRISIWQQFSSNHSGAYFVAGNFKSVETARTAYEELHRILSEIYRWQREHSEEIDGDGLLPPEIEFAQQYDVEWPQTIDRMNIDEAIKQIGQVLVLQNPGETWMKKQPFKGLLERLGAVTFGYDLDTVFPDFDPHFIVQFAAPDTSTADTIDNAISLYLAHIKETIDNLPPWIDDAANYNKVLGSSKLLRRETIAAAQRNWQRHFDSVQKHNSPRAIPMAAERLALTDTSAKLVRNHLDFTIEHLYFHNMELGFSALIAYLEANNCTNINARYADTFYSTED